jgi:dTDP-4-dehydrorhamnose reductase
VPIRTAVYQTPARRPAYGVLDTALFERTFGFALPDWQRSLVECMNNPAEPPGVAQVGCAPPGRAER